MKVGLLWFDDDEKQDLAAKIARAAAFYQQKYGRKPELCYVHPAALERVELKTAPGGVAVKPSKTVLPNHFWLGVSE